MHDPPPSVYESWPAPNYVNPETRGPALVIINAALGGLAFVVVALRVFTRARVTRSFASDDFFICLSLLPSLGLTGCTIASQTVYHWDRHIWNATAADVRGGLILEFACALLYVWASLLTKLSIIFFCRRLLCESHPKWYRRGLDVFLVLTIIGNVGYTLVFVFSCRPLSGYWDHYPPTWEPDYSYQCIDIPTVWMFGSILNCSWDLLTWLVPLPVIYQLHLPMRKRIAVMALFTLGLCVVVASVLRTIFIAQAFLYSYDTTWVGWPIWICGALEIDLGILCASVPSLRPLFSHLCPRPDRWAMRRSYAEMGRGTDLPLSPKTDTPLTPLSPVHARAGSMASADDMKPWSYNNSRGSSKSTSRRSSVSKETAQRPPSVTMLAAPNGPGVKRLTPVHEVAEAARDVEKGPSPLGDDELKITPISPIGDVMAKFTWSNPSSPINPDEAAPLSAPLSGSEHEFEKKHARKPSNPRDFQGFNFNVPATSSRRGSASTAPPSYGDFVENNSWIREEDREPGPHQAQ